jgi:hypothetical protein
MIHVLMQFLALMLILQGQGVSAQNATPSPAITKLEIYYFHPNARCPIDQSIEDATRKMMQTDFAKEVKAGTIRFRVVNTDDKANTKLVNSFEMNAQALYLVSRVNGKEVKNDLTEFAFSNSLSNPVKFRSGLKEEILKALK